MTSRNPPSNDATTGTGTGTGTCTALSDAIISISKSNSSDNSDTESLSSWGVIDYNFPSVIAAANNNYEGFPPTVEAEDDVVVEVDVEDEDVDVEVKVEVEDADVEKDDTVTVDEQTSCSDNSSTDKTKHNNDDINNNNNNTTIDSSSKKEGRERKQLNSTQPITENDCNNNGSKNNHIIDTPNAIVVVPLDVDNNNNNTNNDNDNNNDTNEKDESKSKDNKDSIHDDGGKDTSIQASDVPVPFVVGLQTRTIIEELKNVFVGVGDNNDDQQQQLLQLQARQLNSVEYIQAEKLAAFADWGAYLRRYEDLQKVIDKNDYQKARQHYLEYGFKEGRDCGPGTAEKIAATTADWGAYLRRYEDLQKVMGDDIEKAQQHYFEYGFQEKRDCQPGLAEKYAETANWHAYLERYPDLQQAFGKHNYKKARQHYLEHGFKEHRDCSLAGPDEATD